MKHKLFITICLASLIPLCVSGCTKTGDIKEELEQVTIRNILPDTERSKYTKLSQTDDDVYEQQLAACKMLSESYKSTSYENFIDKDQQPSNKLRQLCNDKRNQINSEIATNFVLNLYHVIANVKDCPNQDAFIEKTYADVLNFYDAYDKYVTGSDKNRSLCDILTAYSESNNLLALNFLIKNSQKVYNAATAVIEANADQTQSEDYTYRYYINENNHIINALNKVYEGVPQPLARRISNAGTELAEKLMNSLDSITDAEKERLMEQLNSVSAAPNALDEPIMATMPPLIPELTAPTTLPRMTMSPKATTAPAALPTQKPAAAATRTPSTSQSVQQQPTQQQPTQQQPDQQQPTQQPDPTEEPGYSFSVRDDNDSGSDDTELPSYSFD